MPIKLDIKNDFVYKEGKQEGRTEERNKAIVRMLGKNMPLKEIAEIFNVSIQYVQKIQKELKK